jgi:hypothetical protein
MANTAACSETDPRSVSQDERAERDRTNGLAEGRETRSVIRSGRCDAFIPMADQRLPETGEFPVFFDGPPKS